MNVTDACCRYLRHLDIERHMAVHTIQAYRRDLQKFNTYLATQHVVCISNIAVQHINAFLQSIATQVCASSQNRTSSALKQFFLFLQREGLLLDNPTLLLTRAKHQPALPYVPSIVNMQHMLGQYTEQHQHSAIGKRNIAMLELLYGAGLRVSELCQLRLEQIHLAGGVVMPCGKGAVQRMLPLGSHVLSAMQTYMQTARDELLHGTTRDVVFVNNRASGAISRMALFYIVRQAGIEAGLPQTLSPHTLRHAFATHLLQGGADLRVVQALLGHKHIAATEIYTHIGAHALKHTIDTYHPLA